MSQQASGDPTPNPEDGQGTEDKVAYSTHKKLLGERKRDLEKMRSLEDELNAFRTEKEEREDNKLAEEGKFKELLEAKEKRIKDLEGDNTSLATEITTEWKRKEFYRKLDGELLDPEYEKFVDFEKISINPETRAIDVDTVDVTVNSFLERHPHLVKRNNAKKLPADAPNNDGGQLPYGEALKKCTTQRELDACRRKYGRAD